MANVREGRVFFFFFLPAESPDYGDPAFRHFCNACANARRSYPHVTVSVCRTVLAVACGDEGEGMTYETLARLAGLEYIQAAHHVQLLSSGNRDAGGLGLLSRTREGGGKARTVRLTPKGEDFVRLFARTTGTDPDFSKVVAEVAREAFPALQVAVERLSNITLCAFTVLLHIAAQQRWFGFDGAAAKVIAEQLGVSNFPRHIAALARRTQEEGDDLITLVESSKDKRVKLPQMTPAGYRVVQAVMSALLGREAAPPKKFKREAAERLANSSDVPPIADDDPDNWTDFEWKIG